MSTFFKRFKVALILVPLAIFISFLDKKIIEGFLATNEIPDHYIFVGSLIIVISLLIYTVVRFDKNVNS